MFEWITNQSWWDIGGFSMFHFTNEWLPTIFSFIAGFGVSVLSDKIKLNRKYRNNINIEFTFNGFNFKITVSNNLNNPINMVVYYCDNKKKIELCSLHVAEKSSNYIDKFFHTLTTNALMCNENKTMINILNAINTSKYIMIEYDGGIYSRRVNLSYERNSSADSLKEFVKDQNDKMKGAK